jgi:hypothetical protein
MTVKVMKMPKNNIAKKVRFLGVDGFMIMPILLIMVFPSWFMLYFLIGSAITLFILEKRGLSVFMLFRKLRTLFIGRHRFIRPPWRKNI